MKFKKTLIVKSYLMYFITLCSMSFYVSLPAIAQSKVDRCTNPRSTSEGRVCANSAFEAADNNLNKVYKQIYSKLSRVEKRKLTKAQLNWIKFRDDNCTSEVEINRGGTGYSIFLNECLKRTTEARTKELRKKFTR
jgi:uncharacterized protein YecT (DUF1311 family)